MSFTPGSGGVAVSDQEGGERAASSGFDAAPLEAPRIWSILFLARHAAIVAFAACFALIPSFGDDRLLLAGAVLLVLPYDVGLHLHARRYARLPRSMPFTYAAVPAALAALFPIGWVPAVAATLGNLSLFAVVFPRTVTAVSALLSGLAFGGAGLVAEPTGLASGLVAYSVTAPAIVLGVGALFEARESSERRYREFVENANDMIYTHDLETFRFLSANGAALAITGYSEDELKAISVADIVAPDHLARAAVMIEQKVEGVTDSTRYELEIITKDGRRIPVEVSTRLIRGRGQPMAVQGIARDISERRQVEAQQAALDRAKSEFIANAAHELRTPLTTLGGLASILESDRSSMTDAEIDDAIGSLARQGKRAALLADKLLDLSAIEVGGLGVVPEPVPVLEAVHRALEEAPPPEGVKVDVRVPDDVTVMADPVRLIEVTVNLVTNAYRYGGSRVVIDAAHQGPTADVWVEDDGPGIPASLAETVFEPFTRADDGRRPDSTGLGLAICSRIARALGGSIVYEPADPSGARFRLTLSTAESTAESTALAQDQGASP